MTDTLTANTQAILLLTAPLLAGRKGEQAPLLSLGDYNRLARLLREHRRQPADLVGPNAAEALAGCATLFERERLQALLNRGFLLSQVVQRWSSRAIWVLSRADAGYPRRIKTLLKEDSPPILYGCGDVSVLDRVGLAIVGSRHVTDELIAYTENVGRMAAPHRTVVSGGAKGIDRAAMKGALQAGGLVAGVLADSLERAALAPENRDPLLDGRLVLISPYDPAAGFNVGNAMQRNKLIYALADAALVVSSDLEKGGTWAGAIEQLERFHLVPVFVRNSDAEPGNTALIHRGGLPWPEPTNSRELDAAVAAAATAFAASQDTLLLSQIVHEDAANPDDPTASAGLPMGSRTTSASATLAISSSRKLIDAPADVLRACVRDLLREELKTGRTAEETAARLGVSATQMKAWLKQFVEEGSVEIVHDKKPAEYRIAVRLL